LSSDVGELVVDVAAESRLERARDAAGEAVTGEIGSKGAVEIIGCIGASRRSGRDGPFRLGIRTTT
jgi:hypothetical protein